MTVFGYLITVRDFSDSGFSLVLISIEKISQTLKTLFDHISKLFKSRQKNTPPRVAFSTLSKVFGNVLKHCLSCLIYNAQLTYFSP